MPSPPRFLENIPPELLIDMPPSRSLANMPPELIAAIARYLSNQNLARLRLASRGTRNATARLAQRRRFSARVRTLRRPASVRARSATAKRRRTNTTNMNNLN